MQIDEIDKSSVAETLITLIFHEFIFMIMHPLLYVYAYIGRYACIVVTHGAYFIYADSLRVNILSIIELVTS